jgi:hypothetical protein
MKSQLCVDVFFGINQKYFGINQKYFDPILAVGQSLGLFYGDWIKGL